MKYDFFPLKEFNLEIPKNKRQEALEAAAETLKSALLDYIGDGKSPVSGFGRFPGYNRAYKKAKSEQSSSSTVNLELSGEMLDALTVAVDKNKLSIFIDGDESIQGKAEGNNLGTYGKPSPIPGKTRRFIPLKDEKLKREIMGQIKQVLAEYEE